MEKKTKVENKLELNQKSSQIKRNTSLKEKREKRKKMKHSQEDYNKYMKFLLVIKDQMHITQKEMCKKGGVTPQLMEWWMLHDNASLKTLQKMFRNMGFELECKLKPKSPVKYITEEEDFSLNITGTNFQASQKKNHIYKTNFNVDTLKFLLDAMNQFNISMKEISEKTGTHISVIYKLFKRDNIKVQTIHKIADTFDLKVYWLLKNKEEKDPEEETEEAGN